MDRSSEAFRDAAALAALGAILRNPAIVMGPGATTFSPAIFSQHAFNIARGMLDERERRQINIPEAPVVFGLAEDPDG